MMADMDLPEYVPGEELERRWQRVRRFMDCDALVILQNVDQYYLTGTMQTGVLWFPREGEPLLAIKESYASGVSTWKTIMAPCRLARRRPILTPSTDRSAHEGSMRLLR